MARLRSGQAFVQPLNSILKQVMKALSRKTVSLVLVASTLIFGAISASASILSVSNGDVADDSYSFTIYGGSDLQVYGNGPDGADAMVSRSKFSYHSEGADSLKYLYATGFTASMVYAWDFSGSDYRIDSVNVSAPLNTDFGEPKANFIYSWSSTGLEGDWTEIVSFESFSRNVNETLTLSGQSAFYLKIEVLPTEGRTSPGGYQIQWGRSRDASSVVLSTAFALSAVPEVGTTSILLAVVALGSALVIRRRHVR